MFKKGDLVRHTEPHMCSYDLPALTCEDVGVVAADTRGVTEVMWVRICVTGVHTTHYLEKISEEG